MPLTDLISRITANVTAGNVPKLEGRLADAEADLQTKRTALNDLLTADEDGPAVVKAEDALAAAKRRVENLRGAVAVAQAKQTAEQAEAEQDAQRDTWLNAVKLADDRHAAIVTLAKSMAAFAADYNAVLKINADLVAALPANPDNVANLTDRMVLETALRKELTRLGLPWCFSWPYGPATLPELMPQFDGAVSVIRALVPKDLQ